MYVYVLFNKTPFILYLSSFILQLLSFSVCFWGHKKLIHPKQWFGSKKFLKYDPPSPFPKKTKNGFPQIYTKDRFCDNIIQNGGMKVPGINCHMSVKFIYNLIFPQSRCVCFFMEYIKLNWILDHNPMLDYLMLLNCNNFIKTLYAQRIFI